MKSTLQYTVVLSVVFALCGCGNVPVRTEVGLPFGVGMGVSSSGDLEQFTCDREGLTRQGYLVDIVDEGQPCPESFQACTRGQWVGPELYESCVSRDRLQSDPSSQASPYEKE